MDTKLKIKPASEQKEQMALIKWAKLKAIPLVHIPNEGPRLAHYGANLVKMGLTKGFPDLFMPEARGGYFGMFIEMKQKRSYKNHETLKESWIQQEKWINLLTIQGYYAQITFGWQDASELITMYRSFPKTEFSPIKTIISNIKENYD